MSNTTTDIKDTVNFLATAISRFEDFEAKDGDNRRRAKEDLEFTYDVGSGQWPASVRKEREEDSRPCLTSNKLRKFVAQTANRVRDQRLAGNVRPVDDKGDIQTAQVLSGIIRQIERASDAPKIYKKAFEHAIGGTFGFWRIEAKELPDSFDQELFIGEIKNQFSAYLDDDGRWGFVREKLSESEFEERYPDATPEDFSSGLDGENLWFTQEKEIYISEYFYKEKVKTEIVQAINQLTNDVKILELGKKEEGVELTEELLTTQGWVIIKRKAVDADKVKWAKITQTQILETGDWMGKDIPLICVEGDWVNIDGEIYKRSLITDAKDDQRMHNYWLTSVTEKVALSIKAPYLVTHKMVKGFTEVWKNAQKKLMSYLPFNRDGNLTPRREPPAQVPTGDVAMLEITGRNIQDTIGKYSASFGEKSNERTGVAIRERANRGDVSTYHFEDNAKSAVLKSTRMLLDLIPRIYDTERVVRILGDDVIVDEQTGEQTGEKTEIINQTASVQLESGEFVSVILNDLSMGKYDVVEDIKIMSTRRQESVQLLADLSSGAPQLSMVLAPYMVELSDFPSGMGERIKKDVAKMVESMMAPKGGGNAPA